MEVDYFYINMLLSIRREAAELAASCACIGNFLY